MSPEDLGWLRAGPWWGLCLVLAEYGEQGPPDLSSQRSLLLAGAGGGIRVSADLGDQARGTGGKEGEQMGVGPGCPLHITCPVSSTHFT